METVADSNNDGCVAVSRFAPSPTGYLHLGHLVNAIYVWGVTRALGGAVILRLEDHDRGRCRPEYETAILEDLEWLGLAPDRGLPAAFRGGETPYRQSDRGARYAELLEGLAARGLVYTCRCSRRDVLSRTGPQQGELRYDGHCRDRGYDPGAAAGVRIRLDPGAVAFDDALAGRLWQDPARQCGDVLLRDRHGNWTYQFAVVADDWDQGVNLVIRGEDLLESTGRQILLGGCLGRETPPFFLHHPLIADTRGRKLSKRDFSRGLRDYRAEGWTPERVLGAAALQVGLGIRGDSLEAGELPGLFEDSAIVARLRERIPARRRQPEGARV